MLEMMLTGGDGGNETFFTIIPSATVLNEGSTVSFTVYPSNHTRGYDYHWEVGGSLGDDLIDSNVTGVLNFPNDDPITVDVRTKIDEFRDENGTVTLKIRARPTSPVLVESSPVTFIYSSMPVGQHTQTATGSRDFVVPEGVTEISAVLVGGGQGADNIPRGRGGDGASLRWMNRIPVVPGETLRLEVGEGGRNSTNPEERVGKNTSLYRGEDLLLRAAGGGNVGSTSLSVPDVGGGNGGRGALGGDNGPGGGGGAGGYTGNGGNGGNALVESHPGEGGGAGGGSYYLTDSNGSHHATPGGGVGLMGQGTDGAAGTRGDAMLGGRGGSGGTDGTWVSIGLYGAGARGQSSNSQFGAVNGGNGAIRLIWGPVRLYPNTRTGNL